jgi:hypothetical protein
MDRRTTALVELAADWANEQPELHRKVRPIIEHYIAADHIAEVADAMYVEVMVAMAKALETGIYIGINGFPEGWGSIPGAFENAFEEDRNETT